MNNHSENILENRSVQELVMVANEYCHFIENVENQSAEIVLSVLQKLIPLLYLKGALLPAVHPQNPDALTYFVTEEIWTNIYHSLKNKMLGFDLYYFSAEESAENDPVATMSIAEDLTDIYQDLKDALQLLKLNTKDAQENAIAELRRLFAEHWGIRACRLQYAIHRCQNSASKN